MIEVKKFFKNLKCRKDCTRSFFPLVNVKKSLPSHGLMALLRKKVLLLIFFHKVKWFKRLNGHLLPFGCEH